jgi:hypothetical protein
MRTRSRRSPSRAGRMVLLGILAVLVAGCRIDVTTDVTFDVDGGGEVALAVRIDGATLRDLDRLGIDPGLDVEAALDPAAGWRASRTIDPDGGLVLVHRRSFDDGAELATLLRELSDGLAADDPALAVDLVVDTRRRGAVALAGTAGIAPPGSTGVLIDGVAVGPTGAELEALVVSAVRATLRVTTAGGVVSHDGDRAGERIVEWDLPVGEVRAIALVAEAPGWWTTVPWTVVPLLGAGAVLARRVLRRARLGTETEADADAGADGPTGLSPAG